MTMIPNIDLPPTIPTLVFFAEEYSTTGDDVVAHQASAALVGVWKADNLERPCPSREAHAAQKPDDLVKAAHALLGQAVAQMPDFPPD